MRPVIVPRHTVVVRRFAASTSYSTGHHIDDRFPGRLQGRVITMIFDTKSMPRLASNQNWIIKKAGRRTRLLGHVSFHTRGDLHHVVDG